MTSFLNCSQGGDGGVSWYCTNYNTAPHKLMTLDSGANITDVNNINCTGITMSSSTLSSTAFGYLTSVMSNVQNQINAINTTLSGVFSGITNTGTLTNNGGNIDLQTGYSVFITNGTKFLRMHHNAYDSYFDYTGSLSFRNANTSAVTPVTSFKIDQGNNATFSNTTTATAITCSTLSTSSTSLTYTTLPTFTSSMVGYQTTLYPLSTSVNLQSGINYSNLFSFSLPIGV
jgi:hypothetical protein